MALPLQFMNLVRFPFSQYSLDKGITNQFPLPTQPQASERKRRHQLLRDFKVLPNKTLIEGCSTGNGTEQQLTDDGNLPFHADSGTGSISVYFNAADHSRELDWGGWVRWGCGVGAVRDDLESDDETGLVEYSLSQR